MATYVQWALNRVNDFEIGESSSVRYTLTTDSVVYFGADADANPNRIVPVTDSSAQYANGICQTTTANAANVDYMAEVVLFPCRVITNNIDGSNPPTATLKNRVYLLDAGTWSNADGGSSGVSYGNCIRVFPSGHNLYGYCELNLSQAVDTNT